MPKGTEETIQEYAKRAGRAAAQAIKEAIARHFHLGQSFRQNGDLELTLRDELGESKEEYTQILENYFKENNIPYYRNDSKGLFIAQEFESEYDTYIALGDALADEINRTIDEQILIEQQKEQDKANENKSEEQNSPGSRDGADTSRDKNDDESNFWGDYEDDERDDHNFTDNVDDEKKYSNGYGDEAKESIEDLKKRFDEPFDGPDPKELEKQEKEELNQRRKERRDRANKKARQENARREEYNKREESKRIEQEKKAAQEKEEQRKREEERKREENNRVRQSTEEVEAAERRKKEEEKNSAATAGAAYTAASSSNESNLWGYEDTSADAHDYTSNLEKTSSPDVLSTDSSPETSANRAEVTETTSAPEVSTQARPTYVEQKTTPSNNESYGSFSTESSQQTTSPQAESTYQHQQLETKPAKEEKTTSSQPQQAFSSTQSTSSTSSSSTSSQPEQGSHKPIATGTQVFENSPSYDAKKEAAERKKTEQQTTQLYKQNEEKKKVEENNAGSGANFRDKASSTEKLEKVNKIRDKGHGFQVSTSQHSARLAGSGVRLLSTASNKLLQQGVVDAASSIMLNAPRGLIMAKTSMRLKNAMIAHSKEFQSNAIELGVLTDGKTSKSWKKNYKKAYKLSSDKKFGYEKMNQAKLSLEIKKLQKSSTDLAKERAKILARGKSGQLSKYDRRRLLSIEEQLELKKQRKILAQTIRSGKQMKKNLRFTRTKQLGRNLWGSIKNQAMITDQVSLASLSATRFLGKVDRVVNARYNAFKTINNLRIGHVSNKIERMKKKFNKSLKKDTLLRKKLAKKGLKGRKKKIIDARITRNNRRAIKLLKKGNKKTKKLNKLLAKKFHRNPLGALVKGLGNLLKGLKTFLLKLVGYAILGYAALCLFCLLLMGIYSLINYDANLESPMDTEIGASWIFLEGLEQDFMVRPAKLVGANNANPDKPGRYFDKIKWGIRNEKSEAYFSLEAGVSTRENAAFIFGPVNHRTGGESRLEGSSADHTGTLYFKSAHGNYERDIDLSNWHGGHYAFMGIEGKPQNGCYPVTIDVHNFDILFIKDENENYLVDGDASTGKVGRVSNIKEILSMCLAYYDNVNNADLYKPFAPLSGDNMVVRALNWINDAIGFVYRALTNFTSWLYDTIEDALDIDIPEYMIGPAKMRVAALYATFSVTLYNLSHNYYLVNDGHMAAGGPEVRYCGIASKQKSGTPKYWTGGLSKARDENPAIYRSFTLTNEYVNDAEFDAEKTCDECPEKELTRFTYKFGQAYKIWPGLCRGYDEGYGWEESLWGTFWTDYMDSNNSGCLCNCPQSKKDEWLAKYYNGELSSWDDTDCPGHTYYFCPGHLVCKCCVVVNTFMSDVTLYDIMESNLTAGKLVDFMSIVTNTWFTFVNSQEANWYDWETEQKVIAQYKEDWNDSFFAQFSIASPAYYIGHTMEGSSFTNIPKTQVFIEKFISDKDKDKNPMPISTEIPEVVERRINVVTTAAEASGNIPYMYAGSSRQKAEFGSSRKKSFNQTNYFPDGLDCSGFACWVFSNANMDLSGGNNPGTRTSCSGILGANPNHGALVIGDQSMLPGDLVIKNGEAGGATGSANHVKIFVGWNADGTAVTIECGGNSGGKSTPKWTNIYKTFLEKLTGKPDAFSNHKNYKFKWHRGYTIINTDDDLSDYEFYVKPSCYYENLTHTTP